jgi:hypothetical protein
MKLNDVQKHTLSEIGEHILAALEAVAQAEHAQRSARSVNAPDDALATHPSLMVSVLAAVRNVAAARSEVRQHLERAAGELNASTT